MGGWNLPPGVTTQMIEDQMGHEPLPVTVNAAQRIIGERAEEEVRTCAIRFCDWVARFHDTDTLSRLLSMASHTDPYAFTTYRDALLGDYTAWRVAQAQSANYGSEWDDEIQRLEDTSDDYDD